MSKPENPSAWQPIETASAVGKKRHLFKLANGKMVTGFRVAGTASVVPEFTRVGFLAIGWMPLPPTQSADPA